VSRFTSGRRPLIRAASAIVFVETPAFNPVFAASSARIALPIRVLEEESRPTTALDPLSPTAIEMPMPVAYPAYQPFENVDFSPIVLS